MEGHANQCDMPTIAQQKKSEIDNDMLTEGVFKKQELSQTCKNGHMVCLDCHIKWSAEHDTCPICRAEDAYGPEDILSQKMKVYTPAQALREGKSGAQGDARMKAREDLAEAERLDAGRLAQHRAEQTAEAERLSAIGVEAELLEAAQVAAVQHNVSQHTIEQASRVVSDAEHMESARLAGLGIRKFSIPTCIGAHSYDSNCGEGTTLVFTFTTVQCTICKRQCELGLTYNCKFRPNVHLCRACMLQVVQPGQMHTYIEHASPLVQQQTTTFQGRLALGMGMHARLGAIAPFGRMSGHLMNMMTPDLPTTGYAPLEVDGRDVNLKNRILLDLATYNAIKLMAKHTDQDIVYHMVHMPSVVRMATRALKALVN
jgi:hypothetical protein